MFSRRRTQVASIVCLLSALFCTFSVAADLDKDRDKEYFELMKLFVDTFEQIDRNYVKGVDRRELMEAAIEGMLTKLDQYSSYISPKDLQRFNEMVEQEFSGVGIQIDGPPRVPRLTVISPLPGTPAYKAGVHAGDVIMKIGDKSTEGFTTKDAIGLLKGKAGTPVTITVKHNDTEELEELTIVREVVHVSTVLGDHYNADGSWNYMVDDENKIAHIRLTHFSRRSAGELKEALDELVEQKMRGLILDLRTNPGGLLSQATEICDMFIEEGRIVSTKGRNTDERVWDAHKEGTYTGFPIAILVNRFSASASEIVSACLQDHKRAIVIGERTWGKGSVQNVIQVNEGSSALKLTTASYHRPSGKNIHRFKGATEEDEWGVTPDENYEVRFTNEEFEKFGIYRMKRDILDPNAQLTETFDDRQFAKALEYLKGKLSGEATQSKPAEPNEKKINDEKKKAASLEFLPDSVKTPLIIKLKRQAG